VNPADVVTALDLPVGARVDQRVPKTLLMEHGAPTPADKRRITEGIEELHWVAALKPTTIGVSEYRDAAREYLELAVLSVQFRDGAKAARLAELVHRAVPYPVLLIAQSEAGLSVSVVHKRWSEAEAGKTVLDGELVAAELAQRPDAQAEGPFLAAIGLVSQPRANLRVLYQGWMDAVHALQAARLTGTFTTTVSSERAGVRRAALLDCARLDTAMARVRIAASKEKQISKQVRLNLELQSLVAAHAVARAKL
jgi:hypothetical protein